MGPEAQSHQSRCQLARQDRLVARRIGRHRIVQAVPTVRLAVAHLSNRLERLRLPNGNHRQGSSGRMLDRRSTHHVCRSCLWRKQTRWRRNRFLRKRHLDLVQNGIITSCISISLHLVVIPIQSLVSAQRDTSNDLSISKPFPSG